MDRQVALINTLCIKIRENAIKCGTAPCTESFSLALPFNRTSPYVLPGDLPSK